MTKTSVGKIPFDGPTNHYQILESVRTDINAMGNTFGVNPVAFIVSYFFSRKGLFKNANETDKVFEKHIGRFYPDVPRLKRLRQTKINKVKRRAARNYVKRRRKAASKAIEARIINDYIKWCEMRKEKGWPFLPFKSYLYLKKIDLSKVRKIASSKINKKTIDDILYKFDDKGKIVIRRNTRKIRSHFAQIYYEQKKIKQLQSES